MQWISQIWILFQTLAAQSCPKGIKATKPEGQNWKDLNQPDWNTFSIFGSQNLSKRNQSHQTRRAETQNWNDWNQPDLNTFSIFGSQNVPKRNQIHQTRRAETQNWNDWNQPNLNTFSIFGSQNLSKRNQSHQTKINRRLELKWFQSARFEYFFKLWQPKPVQKESQPPNQKVRFDMVWISQIWILFQSLAAKTCPNGIKESPN